MTTLQFILLTLFNATFCLLLPRLLTLKWSSLQSSVKTLSFDQENETPQQEAVASENLS
ncbi:hypothetical protein [Spirulina sp. CS-785/01]|uniref:hypothetical protein n=1 Tax=Spirulina sp. CS-785/01 TaxID=3021716 RepID=UPI00232CB083|nr:hypothetical protein [Spirulina sp. CS-785/01]